MNLYCIIVTHNAVERAQQLVNSLLDQSIVPTKIIVIDNASRDGTLEVLQRLENESDIVDTVLLEVNTGGAGGFRLGIETALEQLPDYILTFDDDVVITDKRYISKLLDFLISENIDIAGSLMLDCNKKNLTSFSYKLKDKKSDLVEEIIQSDLPIDDVKFFNGCLFKASVLKDLRGPRSEFFIRGDEQEFRLRVIKRKYKTKTCKEAIIYHPSTVDEQIKFQGYDLVDIDHLGKQYFSTRNRNYLYCYAIHHGHSSLKKARILIKSFFRYFIYYMYEKRDVLGFYIWLRAFIDGVSGRLDSQYSQSIKSKYFD